LPATQKSWPCGLIDMDIQDGARERLVIERVGAQRRTLIG
jgi:hypothetical protein